jgi:predicted nucleotidyltransferase
MWPDQHWRRRRDNPRMTTLALAPLLIEHHDAIVRLCRDCGVDRLEVFGSAADGRFDGARSDFDFIVSLSPEAEASLSDRYFKLAEGLEALLGRPVDLLTNRPIRNPYLRRAIDASRMDLYVRPPAEASR